MTCDFEKMLVDVAEASRAHGGKLLIAAAMTEDGVAVLSPATHDERVKILRYLLELHEKSDPSKVVLLQKEGAKA